MARATRVHESEERPNKCQRAHCNNDGRELHSCPYQREINDSTDDQYCNCCESCTQDCAWDI